jgi:Ner family transcriptional regulator
MLTIKKTKEHSHLKEWVKYQLAIRGLSYAELARRNGNVRREVPCKVFYMSYPKWELIIATAINTRPEELWPERYAARAAKKACAKSTRKNRQVQ